jgi:general secretion pathway protein A
MYEAYWRLTHNPFDLDPTPENFFASDTHQAALLKLRYVIENGKGTALLTGTHGTGKSYLLQLLARAESPTNGPVVTVYFPRMNAGELLSYLAAELCPEELVAGEPAPVDRLVRTLSRRLAALASEGRRPLVLLDDAHLVEDPEVFQCLRLLVNLNGSSRADLAVVLAGQPELLPRVRRMADFEDRVAVKCLLRPLDERETAAYVASRLKAAGCSRELFTSEAIAGIHAQSGGLPRRINRLCDMALLVGFADDLASIDPQHIEAVAEELEAVIAD